MTLLYIELYVVSLLAMYKEKIKFVEIFTWQTKMKCIEIIPKNM